MDNQKTYIEEYMLKRKGTNTLHRKLKIEQHEPHKNRGELMCSGRVINSCSTGCTHRITDKRQKHNLIWKLR